MSLQNLYGSSHSYMQNLCSGNACNQAPTTGLQELWGVQRDQDSTHDSFHTQNIDIKNIHSHGNVDISLQELDANVSLYQVKDNDCGEVSLPKNIESYATAFEHGLKEGTCVDQGFTVAAGTTSIHIPIVGDIKINKFEKASLQELDANVTLYNVTDSDCGEVTIPKNIEPFVNKWFVDLKEGTCVDQGFTVANGTKSIHIPLVGEVEINTFQKDPLQELYGSSHSYLMDLGATLDRIRARDHKIGARITARDHKIKAAIVSGFDQFKIDAKKAGERVGKDFKVAAKDVEWAAHKAWKGIEWCYHTLPCRKLVEKVGEDAVEDALELALALQNLNFKSFVHNTEDRTEAFFKKHEESIKAITGGAFQSAAACRGNEKCRATIRKYAEKYGLKAVEDGAEVAEDALLQNLYGSSHSYLMDLNFFKGLVNKEEDKVKRGISDVHQLVHHPKKFAHKEVNKAKSDYHKAIPDVKFALHHPWKGAEWCSKNAACRDAVKDFGEDAVEDAVEAAAVLLQNLNFKSFENKTKNLFHKHEKSIKSITGGAFSTALECAKDEFCRATIKKYAEKYGITAVEDGAEVAEDALQNLYGSSHSYMLMI